MKIGKLLSAKVEPEAGESAAHEKGEGAEFEAGEDEAAAEGVDLSQVSDDELIAELKKRGHDVQDSADSEMAMPAELPPM
jgi:hypothetical protein